MNTTKQNGSAQPSLFSQVEMSEKSNQIGSAPVAKLSTYMKTREALWRLIATYPKCMPVEDAIRRARIDFTKPGARALPACCQMDARKEVAS